MERRLYDAALEGSVSTLRQLVQQDPLVLDRVILNSRSETPLHVATMLGHCDFVQEVLLIKPELTRELDSRGSSPLHLASAKGYLEIVKLLLLVNPDMCLARDMEGRNPFHLSAMKGRVSILRELTMIRPEAVQDTINRGETILHVCIKFNQLEALKFLLHTVDDDDFVNAKDDYGFNILHLAVAYKHLEVIKILQNDKRVDVNATNAIGLTALDVLTQGQRDAVDLDISDCLRNAGATSANIIRTQEIRSTGNEHYNCTPLSLSKQSTQKQNKPEDWLTRKRDSLMVVASLIATMAFQSGVNPPGGFWENDFNVNNSNDSSNSGGSTSHVAGTSILAYKDEAQYTRYLAFNTVGLMASMSIVLLLVTGLPFKRKFFMWVLTLTVWVAVIAMAFSFRLSVLVFTPPQKKKDVLRIISNAVIVWSVAMAVILIGHTIRLVTNIFTKLEGSLGKRRRAVQLVA